MGTFFLCRSSWARLIRWPFGDQRIICAICSGRRPLGQKVIRLDTHAPVPQALKVRVSRRMGQDFCHLIAQRNRIQKKNRTARPVSPWVIARATGAHIRADNSSRTSPSPSRSRDHDSTNASSEYKWQAADLHDFWVILVRQLAPEMHAGPIPSLPTLCLHLARSPPGCLLLPP